jgi:hypothetical protein
VALSCFCTVTEAFGIFGLIPFLQWKKDITERIDGIFAVLVPEAERGQWKKMDGPDGSFVGDTNEDARTVWIPVHESEGNWSQSLTITYVCQPIALEKGKYRQYTSIHETFEHLKKKTGPNVNWSFTPNGDKDAIFEKDTRDDKGNVVKRSIGREVLVGDWVVTTWYQNKSSSSKPEAAVKLDEKKSLWRDRFLQLQFD